MSEEKTVRCLECGQPYQSKIDLNSGKEIKSTPCLCDLENNKYKAAYQLLMEYWEELGEDIREEIDNKLITLGL